MFKKAQAAMEFLMTYGWAILVVLAAIGALAYFGVLSPDRFMPEKCTLPSGLACTDFTWDVTNGFQLQIQNSAGFDMSALTVTVNGTNCNLQGTGGAGTLADGDSDVYTFSSVANGSDCTALSGKFKGSITVAYTNQQTSMSHTKVGELISKTG